jgi:uncharacterized RDD family membrane protein YckC
VAGFGPRLLAFLIDGVFANLISIIVFGGYRGDELGSLTIAFAFLMIELAFVTYAGQTPGMRVAGIAVVREGDSGRPKFRWVLVRTALLATIVPALLTDSSGRALHDRAAGTVMVRTR